MERLTGITLLPDLKIRLMFESTTVDIIAANYTERRKLIKLVGPEARFVQVLHREPE